MFNMRLLSACIALSVIVHFAIFMLLGYRVARDMEADHVAPSQLRVAGILARPPQAVPSSIEMADSPSYFRKALDAVAAEQPSGLKPGIVGREKKTPVLPLSIDDYLPPSRLERIPKALSDVNTNVDFRGMRGVVGEAEIILLISSSGDIDDVLVSDSSLPSFVTDEAILRFRQVKFEPGMVGGWTVRSRLRIRLTPPNDDEMMGNPYSAREKAWR